MPGLVNSDPSHRAGYTPLPKQKQGTKKKQGVKGKGMAVE